jgi:hypothetical protein
MVPTSLKFDVRYKCVVSWKHKSPSDKEPGQVAGHEGEIYALSGIENPFPRSSCQRPNRLYWFSNLFLARRCSTKLVGLTQSQLTTTPKPHETLACIPQGRACIEGPLFSSKRFSTKDGSLLLQGRLLRRGQINLATLYLQLWGCIIRQWRTSLRHN